MQPRTASSPSEQRSQAGCIAARMQRGLSPRAGEDGVHTESTWMLGSTQAAGGPATIRGCPAHEAAVSRILIVEDDQSLAAGLSDGLQHEGYSTLLARDGADGLRLAEQPGIDLVILDVVLPRRTGVEVCRALRSRGSTVPVIMLSAKGDELDKVVGLQAGADDYVTKPFSFTELLARVEAVLRRSRRLAAAVRTYEFGDVSVNFRTRDVAKRGRPVTVLRREFRLLEHFIEHRGEVLSRDQLLDAVWDHDAMSPFTRTVDMHVAKLRQKIEENGSNPRWIVTVHRVGYKFKG